MTVNAAVSTQALVTGPRGSRIALFSCSRYDILSLPNLRLDALWRTKALQQRSRLLVSKQAVFGARSPADVCYSTRRVLAVRAAVDLPMGNFAVSQLHQITIGRTARAGMHAGSASGQDRI